MDRLNELRGAAGSSRDSTLDITSPPSESFMSANESSSKYFSLSEVDSSFDISPLKDVSLAPTAPNSETSIVEDDLIPNLSPVRKKSDILDSYKIGKQIEAANILSGGVDIFDDNDNSYDGDELVIDDNIELDEKSNSELKQDTALFKSDIIESTLIDGHAEVGSKDTEVVLQIDGKNVDAIDLGNGLYLYRKEGGEELAAVQIIDGEKQQPSFKFLKVRENAEGNLEVYEEIEVEVQKEMPAKEGKVIDNNISHIPIRDVNKVINELAINKVTDTDKIPQVELTTSSMNDVENESKEGLEPKSEVNLNGMFVKFNESRKSPVIGNFAYHSTPNKEGKPLTKTMVDLQLHPSRHTDNIKKTIEVHTDNGKQKTMETLIKNKDTSEDQEINTISTENEDTNVAVDEKKEQSLNTANYIIQCDEISLKNNVINTLDQTDGSKSEINQPIEKTQHPDETKITENCLNNVLVTKVLNNFEKVCGLRSVDANMSQSNDLQESTINTNNKVEQDDSSDKITKIKTGNEISTLLCEESISNSNYKSDMVVKCQSSEILQNNELLSLQDNSTEGNKNEDNIDSPIREHLCDAVQVDVQGTNENNSKLDDNNSLVPNSNETINLDKDLVDINNVVHETEVDTTLRNAISTCSKVLKEEKEIKDNNGQVNMKEVDIVKVSDDFGKIADVSIKNSSIDSKQNAEYKALSPNNRTTPLVHSEVEDINNEDKSSLKLGNAGISLQSKDISSEKQELLSSKPNENTTVEKPSIDCKNIIPLRADNDVFTDTIKSSTVKPQEIIQKEEIKAFHNKNTNAENITTLKPCKNKEQSYKQLQTDQTVEIVTKLDLSCNDSQKEIKISDDAKSINNISAVPFGKWTEANKQEYLSKIKETKTLVISSNGKAIKNSNDLNRRDVLKKIDSQRHTSSASKIQELSKLNVKSEIVFTNKPVITTEKPKVLNTVSSNQSKLPMKTGISTSKTKEITLKKPMRQDFTRKPLAAPTKVTATVTSVTKKESVQRKVVKDLIDKTIEGMIIKAFPSKPSLTETKTSDSNACQLPVRPTTLDAIEMKMNELHGIPFIERPPHELPKVINPVPQNVVSSEQEKVPDNNLKISLNNKNTSVIIRDIGSEGEVIEHEPVTGDIEIDRNLPLIVPLNENPIKPDIPNLKNDTNTDSVIAEKDFDKFAKRNSVSYENVITVNFEKQQPQNVIKTVIEMDNTPRNYSKNEVAKTESKQSHLAKIQKSNLNKNLGKIYSSTKSGQIMEDPANKNYHSKLQIAYHSALTEKRQLSCPISIIEDQPVKVVFMDAKTDFVPNLMNIQGQELSPSEKKNKSGTNIINTNDSEDSELLDAVDEDKPQEDIKLKTKHQRKQVLTPVETPELELIEPQDLGLEDVYKKKKKTNDMRPEKNSKNVLHKKSYLLGRNVEEKGVKTQNLPNQESNMSISRAEETVAQGAGTAIDSLVKAAEMLDNQSENLNSSTTSNPESLQSKTLTKRGRGRPRKYPLPDGTMDRTKVPSPQKKPRLIDAKTNMHDTDDEESCDENGVKENWTMGKINENIVCPICYKLFRSENVIFKHVKHCSGPSPNRSDTSKRSVGRGRRSQESDDKSSESPDEVDDDELKSLEDSISDKSKSKDSLSESDAIKEVIVIEENAAVKEKSKKRTSIMQLQSRMSTTIKSTSLNNLKCEFCGKIFRQLSYLVNHKLQHKNESSIKLDKIPETSIKTVYSCNICNKEFRKLHLLSQHRNTHNPVSAPARQFRKSSSEQGIDISEKNETSKPTEDPGAGFRCEPCDKSFRKLHHLVEHRETHDGINRQKITNPEQVTVEKPAPPPQCDICKKTFRKLHHLIEHKEQHVETSSEKSDDKSVKSSLSTKDIIHECSLCYMVFPNEHSLNKHTIICQRKKRQSKQPKPINEEESETVASDNSKVDENKIDDSDEPEIIFEEIKVINLEKDDIDVDTSNVGKPRQNTPVPGDNLHRRPSDIEKNKQLVQEEPKNICDSSTEEVISKAEARQVKEIRDKVVNEAKERAHNPKRKTLAKNKVEPNVTKRQKKFNIVLSPVNEIEPLKGTSDDDDDVRYMLNPDYKPPEVVDDKQDKLFLEIKATKRNSLQIERPNSKELIKRRTSLQHPPKIPRLKSKLIVNKIVTSSATLIKNAPKIPESETAPSSDSDDSDVKYSFPVKKERSAVERPLRETVKRQQRKSLEDKRKCLSGLAKRKSLGKITGGTSLPKQSSVKPIKRRTTDVEHRCDCGQLFSSAALLTRHTSNAHTPPRIRKRRSPPPDNDNNTVIKRALRKSSDKTTKITAMRKSSVRNDTTSLPPKFIKPMKPTDAKPTKSTEKAYVGSTSKPRRSGAHTGIPVPEKMRNLYHASNLYKI